MALRTFFTGGLVVGLCVSFVVLGGGCGDDNAAAPTGGISAGGAPKLDDMPALLAKVICDQQRKCLGPAYDVFLRGASCEATFTRGIQDGDIGASKRFVDEGKLKYDAAKAQACLDAYKALTCEGLTNPSPASCSEIFGGTGTAGAACTIGAECAANHFCKAGSACPGVCTEKLSVGSACAQSEDCVTGLACAAGKCAAQVGVGAECDPARECQPGLLCLASNGGDDAKKVCKKTAELFVAALGQPCDPTVANFCVVDAVCQLESFTPASGAVFACGAKYKSGGACKYAFPDGCPDAEYCPTDFLAKPAITEAVCTPRPAPGAPCGKTGGEDNVCAPGDSCERAADGKTGTCITKAGIGASCTGSSGCYSGLCKAGVCAEGLACEPNRD